MQIKGCIFLTSLFARNGIRRELLLLLDQQGMGTMFPMIFKGFPLVSVGQVLGSLLARKGDRRGAVFYFGPTGPRKHVLPMVSQGFPMTVRFSMRHRGTQQNAPYAICPNMQNPMVFQWFSWYGIVIPGRAAGGRIASLPGTCLPGGRKRLFSKVSEGFQ